MNYYVSYETRAGVLIFMNKSVHWNFFLLKSSRIAGHDRRQKAFNLTREARGKFEHLQTQTFVSSQLSAARLDD